MRHKTNSHASGIACPQCGNFIPMSISGLLTNSCFSCPTCGLTLSMDTSASKCALTALEKLCHEQKDFNPNPKFNL